MRAHEIVLNAPGGIQPGGRSDFGEFLRTPPVVACEVRELSVLPAGTHTQSASDGVGCSQKGILRVLAGSDVTPCKDINRRDSDPVVILILSLVARARIRGRSSDACPDSGSGSCSKSSSAST
jgi:hypothetical protein